MDLQPLLMLALAAVLVFWVLGAYNRLVALRNGIVSAWARIDEPLQQRATAIEPLVGALRAPLADESSTLDKLLEAHVGVRGSAEALRLRPAVAERALACAQAESVFAAALARLLALLDQQPELRAQPEIAAPLATLRDAGTKLAFARALYNDAAQAYNDAARQFPTTLVARAFGFGAAGTL